MLHVLNRGFYKSIKQYKDSQKQLCALHQAGWSMGFPHEYKKPYIPKHQKGIKE